MNERLARVVPIDPRYRLTPEARSHLTQRCADLQSDVKRLGKEVEEREVEILLKLAERGRLLKVLGHVATEGSQS